MQVKLKDIAEKSGFSITTISRALAGYDDVNEQTRQRIADLAVSMGYEPNQIARQLRHQRTNTIGMIIPASEQGLSDDYFSELLAGVGHKASSYGYDLLLSAQPSIQKQMEAYRRLVGGRRVDGVVLARTRQNDPRIEYLKQQNYPFVVSGRSAPGQASDFPYIDVDSQLGIKMVVRHFAELGHQHIALLLPPAEMAFTPFRLHGYHDGLSEANLPYRENYIFYGDLKHSGGYQATLEILNRLPSITAIVACNDLMAIGAMSALQEQNLKVGQDIALSGFDDIPAADYSHPPLTTVHQPIYEIGQRLVEMLIQIVQGNSLEESQILLEPTLIVRDSSGSKRS